MTGDIKFCHLKKLLLIMKISAFILFVSMFNAVANQTYSQSTKVSLKMENASVKEVLKEIEHSSEFYFLYNNELIDVERKLNIEAENTEIKTLLAEIFKKQDVKVAVHDRHIILTPQQKDDIQKITGTVTDKSGGTLPGVNVVVKGSGNGVVTNSDGTYEIAVKQGDVLVFSFIGMSTKEVAVSSQTVINIVLEDNVAGLEEVVVVGYGTQKKVTLTGAVGTVKTEDVEKANSPNTVQALQGKIAGVTINDFGGAPGNQYIKIRVRGTTSLAGGNDPLVLIDGVERSLGDVEPSDIETYSVLKDAASTAIYGSRAAAGVILITTKSGKKNSKLKVDYGYAYTNQTIGNYPKAIGLKDYLKLQVESYGNNNRDGEAAVKNILKRNSEFNPDDAAYGGDINKIIDAYVAKNAEDPYKYPTHHQWYDAMFNDAPMQKHTLSISGGTKNISARFSINNLDQQGILPVYDYNRTNVSSNVKFDYGKFKMDVRASSLIKKDIRPMSENMHFILHGTLWSVPKFEDGSYGGGDKNRNPLLWMEKSGKLVDRVTENIFNWKGSYEILKGLTWTTQVTYKERNFRREAFKNKGEYYDKLTGRKISGFDPVHNTYNLTSSLTQRIEVTNILRYNTKLFDDHSVNALIGHNDTKNEYETMSAGRRDFYNNDLRDLDLGLNDETKTNSSGLSEWGLRSFFGRINYNYKERYLLEANVRIDGSSRFPDGNRYGTFPSFSAGWRVSEEAFWANIPDVFNNFKLRASWGQVGAQTVGLYAYYPTLSKTTYPIGGEEASAYYQSTDPNDKLQWETTTQWDLGFDAGFFNNRLNINFDYFDKTTEGILMVLPISGLVGLNANYTNAGIVSNKGWEFSANITSPSSSEFKWDATLSISDVKNKIEDLVGTGFYSTSAEKSYRVNKEGLPMNSLYGYIVNRTYQPEDFDENGILKPEFPRPKNGKVYPGDLMFEDLNGDGKITKDGDATDLGNTFPRYTYGLTLNAAYKGFDMSMFIQGVGKANVALQGAIIEGGNWEGFTVDLANDYWTPENTGARFPRPDKKGNKNTEPSSWWVVDASYVKLKNIQIGYTLPKNITDYIKLSKVRFYMGVNNVFYMSDTKEWGLDPEVVNDYNGRLSYYPQTRQYTFGVNVSF